MRTDIVCHIKELLHDDNRYVQLFKVAKELFDQCDVPTNIKVVINEMKQPAGAHPRRYNSPLGEEIGILMPDKNTYNRGIVLYYRDGSL